MKNIISPDLVRRILIDDYSLQPEKISAIHVGTRNKSFIISTSEKKYVLRIYAANRTKEHIVFELSVMKRLVEKGLPIPHITQTSSGEMLTSVLIDDEERTVILMDLMEGRPLSERDTQVLAPLAVLQARMHIILKDSVVPRKGIDDVLADWSRWSGGEREKMKPILKECGIEEPYLEMLDETKNKTELILNKLTEVPYAECHNDLFGENILIENDQITAILDFDNLTASPLIFDIANTIFSWLFHSYPDFDATFIEQYIKAYQSERELSKAELELLIPLIARRNFAVTNSLYTHGFIEGRERLDKTMLFHKTVIVPLLANLQS